MAWVAKVSLALSLVYTVLFLANSFGETFFVLSHRSMVSYVVNGVLFSSSLDPLVWGGALVLVSTWTCSALYRSRSEGWFAFVLFFVPFFFVVLAGFWMGVFGLVIASFLLGGLCLGFSVRCFGVSRSSLVKGVIVGGFLVFLFVELAALILFNVPVVMNLLGGLFGGASHWFVVELNLSNLAYPLLPYLYLFFVVLGVVAFGTKVALTTRLSRGWIRGRFSGYVARFQEAFEGCKNAAYDSLGGRFPLIAAVLVSILVSSLFVVVTVLPWANPTYRLVSVDAPVYYEWLVRMRGLDVSSALSFALSNNRVVFLVLQYALSFFVTPVDVVQFIPILLIGLFCVVSLLVLRVVCGFREARIYGVLLVPFSLQALGLIYSGYFANFLAVIFVYVYFILLLRVFRSGSSLVIFGLLVVSLLVLFTHSWTWYILVLSLVMFLFLEWRLTVNKVGLKASFKWKVSVVGATIVMGLVSDLARTLLTSTSALLSVFETAQSGLSFPNGPYLLSGLRLTTNFYLGGVFANTVLVVLSIVGFLFMLTFKSEMSRLLTSWVFAVCVPVFFASGDFVFNRFLFLVPSVVLSSLGLCFFVRFAAGGPGTSRVRKLGVQALILAFVFMVLLNFGLRYVANINVV